MRLNQVSPFPPLLSERAARNDTKDFFPFSHAWGLCTAPFYARYRLKCCASGGAVPPFPELFSPLFSACTQPCEQPGKRLAAGRSLRRSQLPGWDFAGRCLLRTEQTSSPKSRAAAGGQHFKTGRLHARSLCVDPPCSSALPCLVFFLEILPTFRVQLQKAQGP